MIVGTVRHHFRSVPVNPQNTVENFIDLPGHYRIVGAVPIAGSPYVDVIYTVSEVAPEEAAQ